VREKAAPSPPPEKAPAKKEATDSGERRRFKKGRPHGTRKKKRREGGKDWGRLVLVGSLVLLGVAALVLVLGLLRHSRKGRASASENRPSIQVLHAARFEHRISRNQLIE
ncbi:MAG TPA: hypothetical protein VKD72_23360, partial [Gemmataceae bacterium]|nr:hypothetical protein [Gemmataceae bacterium]